mgnify:CR=1 FL=1
MSMRKLRRIGSKVLTAVLICSMSLFPFSANAAELCMPTSNVSSVEEPDLVENSTVTEEGLFKENSEDSGNGDRGLKEETEDKGTIFDGNSEEKADNGSENEDKGLDKNTEDKDTEEDKDILKDEDTAENKNIAEDKDTAEDKNIAEDKNTAEDKDIPEDEDTAEDKDIPESSDVSEDRALENTSENDSKDASGKNVEKTQDIIIELKEENLERARVEPISKFNIVQISGLNIKGTKITEKLPSQDSIDRTTYTARNTYKREGLTIDIRRRGSDGSVTYKTPDCEINSYGAPYDVIYDAYGGLIEYTTRNSIEITNPDITKLHIQFVVYTSWSSGNQRQIIRDVYIPLEDERTAAPQSPEIIYTNEYPDSYVLTGVDSSMEYAICMDPFVRSAFTWETCTEKNILFTPGAREQLCFVRYKSEENISESQYKELKVPCRKSAPALSYDRKTEKLTGLTIEMEYCVGEGDFKEVTEDMISGNMSDIIDAIEGDSISLKIRYRSMNEPVSFEKVITLYKRLAPPANVTLDLVTFKLMGTSSDMEYKTDDMESWKSASSSTTDLKDKASAEKDVIVQVRFKATTTSAFSKSVTFTIPKLSAAPTGLSTDYQLETIVGFDTAKSYEYSTSPTGTYRVVTLSDKGEFTLGSLITSSKKTLYFRERASEERPFSAYAKIDIPARRALPSTIKFVYNNTNTPETQAVLINVSPTMEYQKKGDAVWTSFEGNSKTVDIQDKSITYYVREKATESEFVSSQKSYNLQTYYSLASCKMDLNNEEISSLTNIMEYRINGGEFISAGDVKKISVSEYADSLSENETCVFEVRYMRRENYPVGKIKTFIIHPRPMISSSSLNYDPATFILSGVSKDMQYREKGKSTWKSVGGITVNLKTLVNGRPDVQIEVRYKPQTISTDNYRFASDIIVVDLY